MLELLLKIKTMLFLTQSYEKKTFNFQLRPGFFLPKGPANSAGPMSSVTKSIFIFRLTLFHFGITGEW